MIEFSDLIKTLSMDAHVQIMIFGSPSLNCLPASGSMGGMHGGMRYVLER